MFYADHPLSVLRDDAYWRVWTRWDDPQWRRKFYLAEDNRGAPRGYLALETHSGTDQQGNRVVQEVSLAEMGCEPDDSEAARMLIGFASQMAHMAGAKLLLFLPESDIERFVRPLLPEVRWIGNGSAMVRVCNGGSEPAVVLALTFGLPTPESASIPFELRERYPVRPACYSLVDSF
ncbi:MAG: hypothetical protein KatS3mg017_0580 [Fimbriimonadales bacterium]|nr:MAG: hypothetical protein KatS3mg017_0580 [Fimbriimonadales bacterium]